MLVGCGSNTEPTAPFLQSGVQGRAMVDGGCRIRRPDSPCPDIPHPARIVVVKHDTAAVVAAVNTDTNGVFRVPLEPGVYRLQPMNVDDAMLPRATELRVTVKADRYEDLTILFDSGVRGTS